MRPEGYYIVRTRFLASREVAQLRQGWWYRFGGQGPYCEAVGWQEKQFFYSIGRRVLGL
jgi:hypothetical protein